MAEVSVSFTLTHHQRLPCRAEPVSTSTNVSCIYACPYRCAHPGCTTIPIFNKPGEAGGVFCKKNKEPDMVDVVNRK